MKYRKISRTFATLIAAVAVALATCGAAFGSWYFYAQKTWLPGYDASSVYDYDGARYVYDEMMNKSCRCSSRVAFIDTSGNWRYSYTDATLDTYTTAWEPGFTKKGYCRNNSSSTYTAACVVQWPF